MNMRFAETSMVSAGRGSAEPADRHLWIDLARALALLLVVAGHAERGLVRSGILSATRMQDIDNTIYSFHIPLFFLISGLLYLRSIKRHPFMRTWKERAIRLAKPALIWSVVLVALLVLAAGRANSPVAPLDALWGLLLLPVQPVSVFWFLYTLLICVIVSGLLLEYLRLTPGQVLAASAVIHLAYLLFFSDLQAGPGLQFVRFAEHQLYFALGIYLAPRVLADPARSSRTEPTSVAGQLKITAVAAFSLSCFAGAVAALLMQNHSYHSPWGTIAALSGSAAVLFTCYLAVDVRKWHVPSWLRRISTETLAIFCMHVPFIAATRTALLEVGTTDPALHFVAAELVGVAGPLLALNLMKQLGLVAWLGFAPGRSAKPLAVSP